MRGVCSPQVRHRSPAPPVLEAVPNKTERLHLPKSPSRALRSEAEHRSGLRCAAVGGAGSRGKATCTFSWFVLCRVAKNEHPKHPTAQRAEGRSMCVKRSSCLAYSPPSPRRTRAPEGRSMCVKRRIRLAFAPSLLLPSHSRTQRAQYVRKKE